jgi:hypothetical protein
MGIKAIVESLDDLPDELKGMYSEHKDADGEKFVLEIDDVDSHPKVRGLISSHRTSKQARDTAKAELDEIKKRFSWVPEDLDADALEALKDAAEGKGGKPTDEQLQAVREKVREKLETKFNAEIGTRDERISRLEGAIRRMTVDDGLSSAMDAANIDAIHKAKLLPYLKTRGTIQVEEDGEAFKAAVDTDMGPVSLAQFVSDWAGTDDGKLYVAKSTGPNPKGGNRPGAPKTITRGEFDALNHKVQRETVAEGVQIVD